MCPSIYKGHDPSKVGHHLTLIIGYSIYVDTEIVYYVLTSSCHLLSRVKGYNIDHEP